MPNQPHVAAPNLLRSGQVSWKLIAVLLGPLALAPLARAESSLQPVLPTDTVLARLIDESLAVRPEVAQAQAAVTAEGERIPQAGALPDPMLQVGIQNDGFTSLEIGRMDTSFVSLMASQTFPWPGKLGLRQEIATLGTSQAEQLVARVRLSTEAEVRRTYLDLLFARERRALLDRLEVLWKQSLGVARVRYEAGTGAQSDVLRAQLELTRIGQRRIALQADERSRIQALNRLRVHPLDEPIETSTHVGDLGGLAPLATRFSADRAVARSPEVAAARAGATRANQSVALAERGSSPDLTVGAGVMFRGSLPPMWLATVGGPVPVYAASKQRRAVAENRARGSAARQEVAVVEQLLRLRSGERQTAFAALVQMIERYEHGLLVQSEATTESTLAQYKVGNVSFASVMEATAGFIADQQGRLESIVAAHRLLIAEEEVSLAAVVMPEGSASAAGASAAGMPSGGSAAPMGKAAPAPASGNDAASATGGGTSGM